MNNRVRVTLDAGLTISTKLTSWNDENVAKDNAGRKDSQQTEATRQNITAHAVNECQTQISV